MSDDPPAGNGPADWAAATFAGARREQLRRWAKLSLRQILEAQEEMQELALRLAGTAGESPAPAGEPPAGRSGGD
ncbi:MAG: hypothetical protein FJ191_03990 [Gammaproteobacteria bacterium]|nr:hypothetical protein [Gammaproteobacteria bacterium]